MWAWLGAAGAALSAVLFAYGAWLFGRSLGAGKTPLVTQFAQTEQAPAPLSEPLLRYTARLTRLWLYVLLLCCMLSALRFGLRLADAPLAAAVWFLLGITPLALIVLLLVVERKVRLRRFGPSQLRSLRTQWRVASDVMRQQLTQRLPSDKQ